MKHACILAIIATLSPIPVTAHEFWLEPEKYQVLSGESIRADLRNGQKFEGVSLPYNENSFLAFERAFAGEVTAVKGRLGDRPGLQTTLPAEGLASYAYTSTLAHVNYTSWEKFQAFVDHKDFGDVQARHSARGLDPEKFKEAYTRFAKTLVGVGNAAGQDRAFGMETELVALANPYTDITDGTLQVQALYQSQPRPDVQIELFEKAPDDSVSITLHRTNDAGVATLPVKAGHSYIVDAVVLRVPSAEVADKQGAVWETLWASLTFSVPQ
ncbi:DUF4198 domain-containing protein [Algirhabdus cladophorae]|uniref:DUF4198 domain-containing protein n=1 Tax=Algirhabdus cladophorae TaxID=3377108 RepID=UPI003B849415